jgi:hypothetical protein
MAFSLHVLKTYKKMIENIKARFLAKKFNIYTEKIVDKGNGGYFLYNGKIYYGNRFLVFMLSHQNEWFGKYSSVIDPQE